jgi:hypothetical protein
MPNKSGLYVVQSNRQDSHSKNSNQEEDYSGIRAFLREFFSNPFCLGVGAAAVLGPFILWGINSYEARLGGHAASIADLSALSQCEKMIANQRLAEGKIVIRSDLKDFKVKCAEPAGSREDQAAALAVNPR